ncbi:unnamed protein product, partial [Laminaria digitata]
MEKRWQADKAKTAAAREKAKSEGWGEGWNGGRYYSCTGSLEWLRNFLAEATGTPVSRLAPVCKELVGMSYASWIPFLRCAALVLIASCTSHNVSDADKPMGC